MKRLVLVLAVVLVNLPWAHQAWTGHRLDSEGREVEAIVTDTRADGDRHFVDYRLPAGWDRAQREFSAQVDTATSVRAEATERLTVRVVPGEPGTSRPDGEVDSPVLLAVALGADAIVLALLGLWWWRRRHPDEAVEDVTGAT